MRQFVFLNVLLLSVFKVNGQDGNGMAPEGVWTSAQFRLNTKPGFIIHFDASQRFYRVFDYSRQWIFRPGIGYRFDESFYMLMGYARSAGYPETPGWIKQNGRIEDRFFTDICYRSGVARFMGEGRIRYEQRYFDLFGARSVAYRFRFRTQLNIMISKLNSRNKWHINSSGEILLQSGNLPTDAVRIYEGVSVSFHDKIVVQVGEQFQFYPGSAQVRPALILNMIYSI